MTKEEASQIYGIPIEILDEYESWGVCHTVKEVMGVWQYDDTDLERLGMIMTLHDIGFESADIEKYLQYMISGKKSSPELIKLFNQKRNKTLDEIHFYEKRLERLDYLRHEIRKNKEEMK